MPGEHHVTQRTGRLVESGERGSDKVVAIIQARMGSQRLPRKVALDIHGKCLLERVVGQVQRARSPDEVVVATSTAPDDEIVERICRRIGVACHRGSLTDVRSRFIEVGTDRRATVIVRITADNPLTEPSFIDAVVAALRENPRSEYAMMAKDRIPDGSGAEAFRLKALLDSAERDDAAHSREHVTPALRVGGRVEVVIPAPELELGEYFVGIDTFEHYVKINRLFDRYGDDASLLLRLVADVRAERVQRERNASPAGP